jgi:pyrimidine-nucleoside phosphorylase
VNSSFDAIIAKAVSALMTDDDVVQLARQLAASGGRVQPRALSADIASTGGPGSMSTLWCPGVLAAVGCTVPKLGVPGRPSGGVDSLAQVPGYRVHLGLEDTEQVLDSCGYAHVLAGREFAPADAALFARRQSVGAQNVPVLAMASLLSKKLAMGVRLVGLEVRVAPHGNFGASRSEAAENAERFCRIASLLDLDAVCFLTEGTIPQQPYLGRGEMLLGLSLLLSGSAPEWLSRHARDCEAWAAELSGLETGIETAIRGALVANLGAQGGGLDALEQVAAEVADGHDKVIISDSDGIVDYDLGRIRDAILAARGADNPDQFNDSAGIILLIEPWQPVRRGEPLMSARCKRLGWPAFRADLKGAVRLADPEDLPKVERRSGAMEIVRD